MSAAPEHQWHRCALIHDSFWLLGLPRLSQVAYLYLSTYCQKPWPISLTIMARVVHADTKRLKRAVDILIARKMVTKSPTKRGKACLYHVTLMRGQGWGQTPLPIGSNAPTHLGSNAPTTKGQTPLLTTALSNHSELSGDTLLLSIFQSHFSRWTFNRKPIGSHFHFTRKMQSQAMEFLRWLNGRPGYSTTPAFTAFFDDCREYLAMPRDVLCGHKDQRALSPGRWLTDWPEQVRLVGIYRDEKAEKITRMPPAKES